MENGILRIKVRKMKLLQVLRNPQYLVLAAVSSLIFSALYIYTQVLGNVHNIDVWFAVISWYNAILFVAFAILFGITFSFQVYNWLQPKICSIEKKTVAASGSGIGTLGLFLVAQCPACASLGALFLPVSAFTFISQLSTVLNIISIALLLFTLNYLGAFKKEADNNV